MIIHRDISSAPRILILEDEIKTWESVAEAFRQEGWAVIEAGGAKELAELDAFPAVDLIILDWMLPDRDGLEILRRLRARGAQTPVLMLTARDRIEDRVIGLETGADDYLVKPFAVSELIARSRALLRRPTMQTGEYLRCGDLQLDTRSRTAVRGEAAIALTPREVDVLEYLLRYQGQIVTREMLERDVWKQTHRFTSLDNVIDVQIMRLRKKIDGDRPSRLLQTVRGVGYRIGSNLGESDVDMEQK